MANLGDLISGVAITGAGVWITFSHMDSVKWVFCGIVITIVGVCGLIVEWSKLEK